LAPGDIVVADNLASHKVAGVREAIEARDASLWFLPAYSPDLNPIEQGFAKIKARLRKAAPRSREALWQNTGSIVQDFTPAECANFLTNAGYGQSA
jgi:transposase